ANDVEDLEDLLRIGGVHDQRTGERSLIRARTRYGSLTRPRAERIPLGHRSVACRRNAAIGRSTAATASTSSATTATSSSAPRATASTPTAAARVGAEQRRGTPKRNRVVARLSERIEDEWRTRRLENAVAALRRRQAARYRRTQR